MSEVRLFISHAERDEELVRPLYNWFRCGLDLEEHEIRCTSVDNISTGRKAIDKLRDDIQTADAVVALLTTNSLRSYWVTMEMGASWLKASLFPVRGPGIKPRDLPAPLPTISTVGYCEKQGMSRLLRDLANLMHAKINEQAEFDLDAMIGTAEDFMRRQLRGWFELPAILSAWRLSDEDFVAPLRAKLQDLHFDDAQVQEVQECTEPTGLITRDPDSLPPWAKDYWTLSKLTVNHILTDSGQFVDIPHSILDEKLTVELRRAWTTNRPKRAKMLRDWMENASSHVARNLPLEGRGH